jgi:hypothetical protein
MSDAEAQAILTKLPTWNSDMALSLPDIRAQYYFYTQERIETQPMGKVSGVVLPPQDPICWPATEAAALGSILAIPSGTHELSSYLNHVAPLL